MSDSKKRCAVEGPGRPTRIWIRDAILIAIAIAAAGLAGGPIALSANDASAVVNAGASVDSATSAPEFTAFAPTYEEIQKAARDRGLSVPGPIPTPQPATALQPSESAAVNAGNAAPSTSRSSEFPTLHVVIGGLIGAGIGLLSISSAGQFQLSSAR